MDSRPKHAQPELLPEPESSSSDIVEEIGCCDVEGREGSSIVVSLNGGLLREADPYAYFMLVAFEAGGILRAMLLLLSAPVSSVLSRLVSKAAGIQVLIFVSLAGLKVESVQAVARAVLPKFFREDMHDQTWTVVSSFGTRYVLTSTPRILVQTFAREFLGVDEVFGTELEVTTRGRMTGFVKKPGVLVGRSKASVLREKLGAEKAPDCGVGDGTTAYPFLSLCKEAYIVPKEKAEECTGKEVKLPKTIVFHDGRFVRRPTRLVALLTLLWIPIGFALAWLRLAMGMLPFPIALAVLRLSGVQVKVSGIPRAAATSDKSGVLFVCNHRTLLDPVFLSLALGRRVPALTYSISRVTELLSPIKTVRMTRDRQTDAELIRKLLAVGDLCVCPEGTTCREPFLLRFSAMFAELTDEIVPVAINTRQSMLHGTTANGWKGMDLFFFFMNPAPVYELTFLNQVPPHLTCGGGGKASHEVANYIQHEIARTLKFECTNFTRKDKYGVLAGTDGSVKSKSK